jgi:hypothetical protein
MAVFTLSLLLNCSAAKIPLSGEKDESEWVQGWAIGWVFEDFPLQLCGRVLL